MQCHCNAVCHWFKFCLEWISISDFVIFAFVFFPSFFLHWFVTYFWYFFCISYSFFHFIHFFPCSRFILCNARNWSLTLSHAWLSENVAFVVFDSNRDVYGFSFIFIFFYHKFSYKQVESCHSAWLRSCRWLIHLIAGHTGAFLLVELQQSGRIEWALWPEFGTTSCSSKWIDRVTH